VAPWLSADTKIDALDDRELL